MHINEFQNLMRRLYFHRDCERGIAGTYNWLKTELNELEEALEVDDRAALEREFADVIAWLASLANIVAVDLEKAATDKYDNRCPKCSHIPCKCPF